MNVAVECAPTILPPPFKKCACGNHYTMAQWNSLRLIGQQDYEEDGDKKLELRDCTCGSTIAILKA